MCPNILRIVLLLLSPLIHAAIQNVTIDDTFGDLNTGAKPTYLPAGRWQHPDCGGCAIKPPLQDVFMQTYSALTYDTKLFSSMSIQFSFQGVAIYVYFIVANFVSVGTTTETFCNFTLDGEFVSQYHHLPSSSKNYEFNSLVFSKGNLPNASHTLHISTSGINRHLFTSFDYAVYQFDDGIDSTTSQTSPPRTTDQTSQVTIPSTSTEIISSVSFVMGMSNTLTPSETPRPSSSGAVSSLSTSLHDVTVTGGKSGRPRTTGIPDNGTALPTSSSPSSTNAQPSSNDVNDDDTVHKAPSGIIAGGVVGGIAVIILLLLLFLLCRRRRRAHTLADTPSTKPEHEPQYPVLMPFTPSAPRHQDVETRAIEEMLPFTPIRKQRDVTRGPVSQTQHSPSASTDLIPDMHVAPHQSSITDQIQSLRKELDASESSASGVSRVGGSDMSEILQQNRAMKAEIERLQSQLDEAPPRYPGSAHNSYQSTSSALVTVS